MEKFAQIRQSAYDANMQLPRMGLVLFTFGNVSVVDRNLGVFAIKPSGIPYEELTPDSMVIVDLKGKTVEGKLHPSSDTLTHSVLYQQWPLIGAVTHTHSTYATAWAQSLRDIPIYGTTHADHLACNIPCAPPMEDNMIEGNYEYETGHQIINFMNWKELRYEEVEMILVGNHGPFTWGITAEKAVYNSAVLEELAKMACLTEQLRPDVSTMKESLIRKHYERKHGPASYYGQG
jgi:L-ribulose-5-phosphate 4-epimerase